jgi:phage baseplate assembly protein gpV
MPNILTVPASGIISFDSRTGTDFNVPNLENSVRIAYDSNGGLNINSYVTGVSGVERFSIDGTQGRLFSVTDILTGTLFSVNNIAGLPILEVKDFNTVIAGQFNTNALVVSGSQVALGLMPYDASRLGVSGNVNVIGNITASGNINASGANFQNLQKFITGLSTGIDSYTGTFQYPFSNTPVLSAAITYTGAYGYMSNFSSVTLTGFVLDFSDIIKESGVELSIIAYG